jgi:hypothetical protein
MTINRAVPLPAIPLLAALFALSACGDVVPRADERQPQHPAPAPPPPLPPRAPPVARVPAPVPAPTLGDWRDVPLPAGTWTWALRPGGSAAWFGLAGRMPVAVLQCDRAAGVVRIAVPVDAALAPAPHAATITTSTSNGTLAAEPHTIDGLATMAIALPVSHRLLDAMAFSRGRFRIEISGMAPVVVPSWSEVGRVVEDCRG